MTSRAKRNLGAIAVLAIASLSVLFAQTQVNTRVQSNVSPAIYGANSNPGAVRYSNTTSVPMASELRYEYYKSGSTPSDVRFAYSSLGARTPGGPMRYIDYKPSYVQSKKPSASPPPVAPTNVGSIRHASAGPPSPNMVRSQASDTRVTSTAVRAPGGATSTAGRPPSVTRAPVSIPYTSAPSSASVSRVSSAVPTSTQGSVRYAR